MTEKEKSALKEAFGFEEPDRKEEFAQEFAKLESGRNKKPLFPFIIKFAAAAAMMTAVIGAAIMMPKDIKHFSSDSTLTETTSETASAAVSTKKAETATAPQTTTKAKTTSTAAVSTEKAETTTASAVDTTVSATIKAATAATSAPITTSTAAARTEAVQPTTKADMQNEKEESAPGLRYRDLTVSVDRNYPLRGKTITEEEYSGNASNKPEVIGEDSSDESFHPKDNEKSGINIDISEMYNDSCAVVLANLDEIVYTSIGGEAFTAENITVSKVFKGDIRANDRVTVFFRGGFIPAEEYSELYGFPPIACQEEYSVEVAGESGGRQNVGHSYVFFLMNNGEAVPDGAYEPVKMGNMSVFEQQQDILRAVGDENLVFTIQQAENGF